LQSAEDIFGHPVFDSEIWTHWSAKSAATKKTGNIDPKNNIDKNNDFVLRKNITKTRYSVYLYYLFFHKKTPIGQLDVSSILLELNS